MLNFEGIAPLFKANQQISFTNQCREVVRFEFEDLVQRLKRIFIPLGAFA